MTGSLRQRARNALDQLRRELLDQRTAEGYWVGELSASALSTATALSAMSAVLIHASDLPDSRESLVDCLTRGIESLKRQQNPDGGFGDTDRSHSNIATSYLVLAASTLSEKAIGRSLPQSQLESLRDYLREAGQFDALRARYGTDKTFVVPILTNLAIAGLVDWDQVPALPFEAAVFPQSMYRMLRMPVVSYAIPALVAIGQARHFRGRRAPIPLRWIRSASIDRTMNVLQRMQPQSGGYLEATPLTSFVVMSLAATGRGNHEVSRRGLRFLIDSMNEQGSWPIDTNLATWVTSLSIHALSCDPSDDGCWCSEDLVRWHLGCQHLRRHPFTGAEPGGWGWSDLSGAVPDSDDTPAAILALARVLRWRDQEAQAVQDAMALGADWLRRLQNRDGGWPTFCRGWGTLPFDRSSNDLTAHAIRALQEVERVLGGKAVSSTRAVDRARAFLLKSQQGDGSWLPLWFGNQDRADESNPVYGTSRVLVAGAAVLGQESVRRGCDYLISVQNEDGGWGGGPSVTSWFASGGSRDASGGELPQEKNRVISSVEETALAVDALASVLLAERNQGTLGGVESICGGDGFDGAEMIERVFEGSTRVRVANHAEIDANSQSERFDNTGGGKSGLAVAIIRGVEFLIDSVEQERQHVAWPIGFYFAKLWYYERLYPLIFSATALGKFLRATAEQVESDWPR